MRYTSRIVSHRSEEFQQLSELISDDAKPDIMRHLGFCMGLPPNYEHEVRVVESQGQPKTVIGVIVKDLFHTNLCHAYSIATGQLGYGKTRDSSLKWVKDQAKQAALNA